AGGNSSVSVGTLGVNITVGGSLTMNAGSTTPDVTDLNVASGTSFVLNGTSQTIDALNGSGTISNGSPTAATLTVGQQNAIATFTGVLSNGGNGALSFAKAGSGKLVLVGSSNSYTGLTMISGGILEIGSNSNLLSLNGTVMFNGGTLHVTGD